MLNYRFSAVMATVFDSVSDATLDYAVSRYNIHKTVFLLTFIAFIGQLIIGLFTGITCTFAALPYVALHGILILLGYICFLKALKYTPIALISLVESGGLFLTLIADCILGYITLSLYFVAMLSLFVFAVALFMTNAMKEQATSFKTIKPIGIVLVIGTVIMYFTAPYIIKVAADFGANEITLNLGYYAFALPYFAWLALKGKDNTKKDETAPKWWNSFYFLASVVGVLEALFYVLETFSYINDTPTIIMAIRQMGIFMIFLLSVLFKTDKFTPQKLIALVLGVTAIIGVSLN